MQVIRVFSMCGELGFFFHVFKNGNSRKKCVVPLEPPPTQMDARSISTIPTDANGPRAADVLIRRCPYSKMTVDGRAVSA
jgi:hypothetical protein